MLALRERGAEVAALDPTDPLDPLDPLDPTTAAPTTVGSTAAVPSVDPEERT